jgi:branched-chain amino acid aminotransferase
VAERPVAVDELVAVREAFLASTLREVHPVRGIDGRALPEPPGPLTRAAAERMRAHIEHELAAPAR